MCPCPCRRRGPKAPTPPPDPLEEVLPSMPLFASGNQKEKSVGVIPLQTGKDHFVQGGGTYSGGGFAPPARPPSPNQTFADGLTRRDQDEPPDPDPKWLPAPSPADAILAEEVYPTADWPGPLPTPADMPATEFDTADRSLPAPDPEDLPDVMPDDSVSQAGRKPPTCRRDLDLEDYRRDHGTRISNQKSNKRRNRHKSEQQNRQDVEHQRRRVPQSRTLSPPLPRRTAIDSHTGPQ